MGGFLHTIILVDAHFPCCRVCPSDSGSVTAFLHGTQLARELRRGSSNIQRLPSPERLAQAGGPSRGVFPEQPGLPLHVSDCLTPLDDDVCLTSAHTPTKHLLHDSFAGYPS